MTYDLPSQYFYFPDEILCFSTLLTSALWL